MDQIDKTNEEGEITMARPGLEIADVLIIRPGTEINLDRHGEELLGIITQVCISQNDAVQYQVVWWDGRQRRLEWINACELRMQRDSIDTLGIGFHEAYRS
jgi:hypothetical protein